MIHGTKLQLRSGVSKVWTGAIPFVSGLIPKYVSGAAAARRLG